MKMHRVGNEFIWATVASIVCGIGLASLLSGSELPLLLIVLVVAAGAGLALYRRRRSMLDPEAPRPPWSQWESQLRGRHSLKPRNTERTSTRSQPRSVEPVPDEPRSRRAGVRSSSLGAPPPDDDPLGSR